MTALGEYGQAETRERKSSGEEPVWAQPQTQTLTLNPIQPSESLVSHTKHVAGFADTRATVIQQDILP